MSSEHIPKIPNRPMGRRRTNDELNASGETSNSPTPTLISNILGNDQNNELPMMPSRRPLKTQTNPAFPTVPPIEPPSRCKSQNELVEERIPRIPLARPSRVTTDEQLNDILQCTNKELEEMQDLISKHDIGHERKVPSKGSEANYASQAIQDADQLSENFKSRGPEDDGVDEGNEGSKFDEEFEESEGSAQNSLDQLDSRKKDLTNHKEDLIGEESEIAKDLSNTPAVDVNSGGKSSGSHNRRKEEAEGSSLNTSVGSREAKVVVDTSSKPSEPSRPLRPVRIRGDRVTEPGDTISTVNRENHAETDLVKLGTGSTDSLVEDGITSKRTAPPIPKKPSSKIAAFQEMLQKQQLEQIHGNFKSTAPVTSKDSAASVTDPLTPDVPNRRPSDKKSKFAQNLNGIFALPGMVASGELPASLSKRLGQAPSNDEKSNSKDDLLGDIRHSRVKGPRGRKLPSKVSNVRKISSQTGSNEIEVFNTWSIVFTKERKNRMKLQNMTSSRREIPHYLSDSIEGLINAGIQERRPSLSEALANKEPSDSLVVNEAPRIPESEISEHSEKDGSISDGKSDQPVACKSDDRVPGHSLSEEPNDSLNNTEENLDESQVYLASTSD